MNRKVLGVVLGVVLAALVAAIIYMVKTDNEPLSAREVAERDCGDGDASKGDKPARCVDYAFELMGRSPGAVDDAAARAVLKHACDHAFDAACTTLEHFEENKLFVAEGRCTGAWFAAVPQSCLDAGKRYQAGIGTARDDRTARMYYDKGCKLGLQPSCEAASTVP